MKAFLSSLDYFFEMIIKNSKQSTYLAHFNHVEKLKRITDEVITSFHTAQL